MDSSALRETFAGRYDRTAIEEFRGGALRVFLSGIPFLTLAVVGAFAVDYYGTNIALATLIPFPILLSILGYNAISRSVPFAAFLTVAGLLALLTAVVLLQPHTLLPMLFCLIVLVAGSTLGEVAGLIAAGASVSLILALALVSSAPIDRPVALMAGILALGSAILSWTGLSPIHVALDWAWQSYEKSRQVTAELRDRQGELSRVIKSLNESYSQLERLNDELVLARNAAEEARRLKAQFAANISHELRTPLNLIIGFSELMTSSPDAYGGELMPPSYQSDLDAIFRNSRHLSGLIDDVLDLSQVEAGRMGLDKERAPISEVVSEATTAVARLIAGKGLTLIIDAPDELPLVYIDRTRIRQVFINLLSNAARFTDQGAITVTVGANHHDIFISVQDTGIGIAAEDLPKVFEEFRQLDGSLHRRSGGSGLGLAISKQFVELHGGSMWVKSELGVGTTFQFTLPLSANVITSVQRGGWQVWDRVMAARPKPPPRVSVVSTDPSVSRIFHRYLDGYEVVGVASVGEIARPDGSSPSARQACVVVGRSMREALERIEDGKSLPPDELVFACVFPGRRDIAAELGVAAFLQQPIHRRQLVKALEEALGRLDVASGNVLLVDDDADLLRLMARWLGTSKPSRGVWLAGSGEEAIAILRAKRPDAVVLDLWMEGRNDGYSVIREVRGDERLRDVPLIIVTAHAEAAAMVTTGFFGVTRPGGLSTDAMMRGLRATLAELLPPDSDTARGQKSGQHA